MGTHRTESAVVPENTTKQDAIVEEVLAEIKQQLALIQFGSLEIQVHNGQVVQIERREKKRWERGVNTN
ncbi:DUF2292 domain-containing protein [Cellvibrio sp. KY-GH-1]|uniref:YezD family protein n=1 Tax=Cellvibrio sp. KY-GH-1 TaxID=2303332 RepID=UPI001244A9B7|nr:YezD family protein [Cellvibrio sp. KY-GH-1]QEY14583.1 DUF2292 domain-containing protein [Cellvibrio sp. KY-GH-1]